MEKKKSVNSRSLTKHCVLKIKCPFNLHMFNFYLSSVKWQLCVQFLGGQYVQSYVEQKHSAAFKWMKK